MKNRRYLIGIFIIVILSAGVGVYLISDRPDAPVWTVDRNRKSAPISTTKGATVNLYFTDSNGSFLKAESRTVAHDEDPAIQGRAIIEALITGPSKGLLQTLPEATGLRAIYVAETGLAYVDLKGDIKDQDPGGSKSELLSIYSIVNSLVLNVPAIRSVKILIEGAEALTLNGHVDLRFPFKANMLMVR